MPFDIAIVIKDEQHRLDSESLARRLSLAIIETSGETKTENQQVDGHAFLLFFEKGILKLQNNSIKETAPVWVDFGGGKTAYRHKHQGKGKLPISRACGIKQNNRPTIIDATAGLGQDAFVLAGLGCKVLCIEQHPVLAALLEDGLVRAKQGEQWLLDIVTQLQLKQGLAEEILGNEHADVVYLDPMYPHEQNKKQAKVNKGMQLFRAFPGTESNEEALLESALLAARDRVVVKRPNWASPLANSKPSHQIPGKTHRYDVYKTVVKIKS